MFMNNSSDKEKINKSWFNLYNTLFKYIIDNKINPSNTELIKLMHEKLNIVIEIPILSLHPHLLARGDISTL